MGDILKKYLKFLFIIILSFLIFIPRLKADTTGTGGIGGNTTVTYPTGSGGWNDWMYGIHIGVFDQNNNLRNLKSYDLNLTNWTTGKTVDPTKLYDYLNIPYRNHSGNYAKLKELAGISLNKGDYILVEPFTYINGKKAANRITFRGIIQIKDKIKSNNKNLPFYTFYAEAALRLANAAKVGTNITVGGHTYTAQNNACDNNSYRRENFCGWSKNHYVGFGITVIGYDQINPVVPPKKGSLELKKIDGNTRNGISGVVFQLSGNGRKYTCTTNSKGVCTINNIIVGTYTLKEAKPAKSYPSNNKSWSITITANTKNNYYSVNPITNTKTCVSEFEDNVSKRLELYRKYLGNGYNYNNLLNFNIHDASNACKVSSCSKNSSISCMNFSSNLNGTFNEYNLSCYDDVITVENVTGYCVETFNFNNSLGISGNHNFGTINSGQLIIKQSTPTVGTGTLTKVCYLPTTKRYYETFKYSDYIKSIKLGDVAFNYSDKSFGLSVGGVSNGFTRLSATVTTEYNLPSVSSSIGSGEKYYSESCTNCRFLGYGLISNLAHNDGEYNLKFDVELNINNLRNIFESNDSCKYNIKNNITTCENETCQSNKLNLEFRIIDTTNPFPGKSGNSRKTGENWCDDDSCSSKNQNVCENIINKKNSYTSGTAKYTIILTPSAVTDIRKDNATSIKNGISYDDFSTLNCDENNNCTSNYLKKLEGRTISNNNNSTYVLVRVQDYKSDLDVINEECRTK